jgi:hypothetical protein
MGETGAEKNSHSAQGPESCALCTHREGNLRLLKRTAYATWVESDKKGKCHVNLGLTSKFSAHPSWFQVLNSAITVSLPLWIPDVG